MRKLLSIFVTILIAALACGLWELPALAGSGAAPTLPVGTMAVTLAGLGLALAGALAACVARRRAADADGHCAAMGAENQALRDEIARRTRIDGERAAQQRMIEEGTHSLAQTNALLAEASDRFQGLFQDLPVACVCCDGEGRVMEWNRVWARLHGQENPLGRTVGNLLGSLDTAPALTEALAEAQGGEAREGVAWTYRRADGTPVHIYSSLFPLRGPDGAVSGVVVADVDMSAQQEAEDALRESEERLHALYNTTSQQNLTFEEKTAAILEMGCAQFGLEIGVLAHAEGEQHQVLQARAPRAVIVRGMTFIEGEDFCADALARAVLPSAQPPGLGAYLGTPIRVDGAVWGMLCFGGAAPRRGMFTTGDRELVRMMAQWIGGEMARRQAEEAVQGSEERFRTAIAAMSEGLILMGADGVIRLWNDSAERILGKTQSEMRGWRPLNPGFAPVREDGTHFPEGSYPLMVSLRRGVPQTDVVMGLPRSGGGMVWVSVNAKPLYPTGSGADAEPSAIVATFSDITERRRQEDLIAVQMAQIKEHTAELESQKQELEAVNAELEMLAMRDGLTGLSNRRAFGQRVALEINRATRYGTPLSLLLLDVDQFKEYNDTFGHVAGDEVLRILSHALCAQGRETDFFARYGGEEFAVILPHTGSEGARILAERLRAAISAAAWPARPVTASIGAATLLPDMTAEDDLVSAADRALYAAKAAGRNRVVHALSLNAGTPVGI